MRPHKKQAMLPVMTVRPQSASLLSPLANPHSPADGERRTAVLPEFASPVPERLLTPLQMKALEQAITARMQSSRNGRERASRLRLLLIFLLLRWQALRLAEALNLDDRCDFRLDEQIMLVRGAHERAISLPPELCRIVRRLLNEPAIQSLRGSLCALDAGFLRRSLYACAAAAGLPGHLVSARVLRNSRAVELCRQGLPLPVVHHFLGLTDAERRAFLQYSPEDSLRITQEHLRRSMARRTSARNVFAGRIIALRRQEFLVDVRLATAAGLEVNALITEESLHRLELCEGRIVAATVKAPLISLEPDGPGGVNRFPGTVRRIRSADFIEEVDVELDNGGGNICALLHPLDCAPALRLEGARAVASFKAFAVVIGLL